MTMFYSSLSVEFPNIFVALSLKLRNISHYHLLVNHLTNSFIGVKVIHEIGTFIILYLLIYECFL